MPSARRTLKRFCFTVILIANLQFFIYLLWYKAEFHTKVAHLVANREVEKISWENNAFIIYENDRKGPGENNEPYKLINPADIAKNDEMYKQEGFYVLVSDKISLDRALPDKRPKPCSAKKYLKKLPNVSVIITFHNEVWSVLLRCVHSILNRSPPELLHEIILVNDGSTFTDMNEPLKKYFNGTYDSKVKIHDNGERQGLIKARMTGAKLAKGDVLIFLDSHMEVGTTWLPPLLEPLVSHPTYATAPIVDGTNYATFGYEHGDILFRGTFDWSFRYNWLPIRKKNLPTIGENYEISCMTGGAYAIRRDHFFYLGGYDEDLKIWNGENFELSFKLWLCSGGILTIPCSRIAHLNKMHVPYRSSGDGTDFISRNLIRVAKVWLDDYQEYFFKTNLNYYKTIDAGDLTKQFELKKKLQCKSFQYYLDHIAPEILEFFPIKPNYFARGSVQNLGLKQCLILQNINLDKTLILTTCSDDLMNPVFGSNFTLEFDKSIGYNNTYGQCLVTDHLAMSICHHSGGNQQFMFNINTRQIKNPYLNKCIAGVKVNAEIVLADCDDNSDLQKWRWGYENTTALNNWNTTGINFSDFF